MGNGRCCIRCSRPVKPPAGWPKTLIVGSPLVRTLTANKHGFCSEVCMDAQTIEDLNERRTWWQRREVDAA
jgi:hypothetical protein